MSLFSLPGFLRIVTDLWLFVGKTFSPDSFGASNLHTTLSCVSFHDIQRVEQKVKLPCVYFRIYRPLNKDWKYHVLIFMIIIQADE